MENMKHRFYIFHVLFFQTQAFQTDKYKGSNQTKKLTIYVAKIL